MNKKFLRIIQFLTFKRFLVKVKWLFKIYIYEYYSKFYKKIRKDKLKDMFEIFENS